MATLSNLWREWLNSMVRIGERVSYSLTHRDGPNSRERVRENVVVVLKKE